MATGGILLTGSGFVPEDEEGAEQDQTLRFIAPGSGNYKCVHDGCVKDNVVMHFPDKELIAVDGNLSELEVRLVFKNVTLQKFKDNCRAAFQKRIDLWMEHEDHGAAILEEMEKEHDLNDLLKDED